MKVSNGMQVCAKCGYSGPMNYDSMDVINAAKKSKSRQSSSDAEFLGGQNRDAPAATPERQKALNERMKKLGGTRDFEVL